MALHFKTPHLLTLWFTGVGLHQSICGLLCFPFNNEWREQPWSTGFFHCV